MDELSLASKLSLLISTITYFLIFIIFGFFIADESNAQDEDLSVIKNWLLHTDASNALYRHLASEAFRYLDKRAAEIDKLQTSKQWIERQQQVREIFSGIVGPFPEKTPLNATVVGEVQKPGYRFEKIIFESLPGFYVTACLFIPDNLHGKAPAIIYCSGHSDLAFRSQAYQRIIINLVKKGFIVFAFDPVGQGERIQYFDPEIGESRVGGPTLEHSYPGAQCFVAGKSQARYMIWDGIRACDYLQTREEVDPKRIGITGRSGGGTQSAYIAAFDDRILAAAPECYITSFKRLIESRGPQDAEQNFYHGIASGIDHADLLEVRAPKPALLIATTRDIFSIQGARETANEVNRAYRAFGKTDNFAIVEDDAPHTSTQKNREAMIAFFQKHLDLPGDPAETDAIEYLTADELRVTKTGQAATSLEGESVFSLNRKEAQGLVSKLEQARKNNLKNHLQAVKAAARVLSGYCEFQGNSTDMFCGRYQREGYAIEMHAIDGEGDYKIPFLLMIPQEIKQQAAVLYLHPNEKSAAASEMEWLAKQGFVVLAPDLIGIGEMGPGVFKGDAYNFKLGKASFNIWFAAIQIGRSIVGIQAGDVARLVNYLQHHPAMRSESVYAVARGNICQVLLHAALFQDAISRIALIDPLISYRSIVMNRYYKPEYIPSAVAGALTAYDLPDLAASLAPRKLLIVNARDQNGQFAEPGMLDENLACVFAAYSDTEAGMLELCRWEIYQTAADIFSNWIE